MTHRAGRFRGALLGIALSLVAGGCATVGDPSASFYGAGFYYDDPWYWGGCCADLPDSIGPPPPRPEHPIANPPSGPRPSQPIANVPGGDRPSQPIATTRAASTPMPRSGGARMGGGGGGRGGGGRR